MTHHRVHHVDGPFFEDLSRGQVFDRAPSMTLTSGRAAAHQAIVGDRLRLPLDDQLARRVAGVPALAHPALVWDVAIGQSTVATRQVRANLFYRGLTLLRQPAIGDTLHTVTTVSALKENSRRDDRPATGLVALHVVTIDQLRRPVLDFHRCAMLPLRGDRPTGHADDLGATGSAHERPVEQSVQQWDLSPWGDGVGAGDPPAEGDVVEIRAGDVVTSAPELARLTLNVAAVHHDEVAAGGRRLVYGGHAIGLALAQVSRAFPDLVAVLAWEGCDHLGPVHEGDTLRSRVTIGRVRSALPAGHLVDLRSEVSANGSAPVLDWRFTVLLA